MNHAFGKLRDINLRRNKSRMVKPFIVMIAVLSLLAAWVCGFTHKDGNTVSRLQEEYPAGTSIQKISDLPTIYSASDPDSGVIHYISVERTQGWGGPFRIAITVKPEGAIEKIIVLSHKETPSFFLKLTRNKFFQQFECMKITSPFIAGRDIDTVSRATISSVAFTKAVRAGSHAVAEKQFGLEVVDEKSRWHFGINEAILLILYFTILTALFFKKTRMRYITMAAGLVFVGFYMNFPISISQIASPFMGYIPSVKENTFWWLLVPGTVLFTLVYGRNIYCYWLCPFGAFQEFCSKLSGINMRPRAGIIKYLKYLPYALTWFSLMVIFLSSNPALGTYEPFATLFSFEGAGVQWFILPVVAGASFFVMRFWCRFFCPVGVVLNLAARVRKKISGLLPGGNL